MNFNYNVIFIRAKTFKTSSNPYSINFPFNMCPFIKILIRERERETKKQRKNNQ